MMKVSLWWIIIPIVIIAAAAIGFAAACKWWPKLKAAGVKSQEEQDENSFWFGLGYSGAAALAAVLIPFLLWFGLQAVKHWLPAQESYADSLTGHSIMVTLVVINGVIGLLAVLMMTALGFSSVKLSDSTQALGLPEGSVRAVIALSLIVIFVIVVVFLFGNLQPQIYPMSHLTEEQVKAIPGNLIAGEKRSEEDLKRKVATELKKQADEIKPQDSPEAVKAHADADKAAKEAD